MKDTNFNVEKCGEDIISANKFCVEPSLSARSKCRKCKTMIPKGILRIGKLVPYKSAYIHHYFHIKCAFDAFRAARIQTNIVTDSTQLDGIDSIPEDEKGKIIQLIHDLKANAKLAQPKRKTKQAVPLQETLRTRISRLKSLTLPTMRVMFTNADQLTSSKLTELKNMLERKKPLIIAICEVKPKNASERTLKDYEIPNYTLHPVNLENDAGRGIAVYTHKSLDKSTIQVIPSQGFQEVCLLEIRLRGGDMLLFGCCYRSPTTSESSNANNDSLNRLLKCLSLKKYSHTCIVGDFNYKCINWSSWTTTHGEDSNEARFIEGIRDCFFHQHIEKTTRRRGNDEPSTLDLVFSNETMQVSEVIHNPPLGKSDHDVLAFDFQCYVDYTKPKDRFLFGKGNYSAMREHLSNSSWSDEYVNLANTPDTTPEDLWYSLKTKLIELTNKFVPLETTSNKPKWQEKGSIPIDIKTRIAINAKEKTHRSWMTAKKRGKDDTAKAHYIRARNKVKTLLRKAKRRYERSIAMVAKSNPKAFWGHTRRYLKTKSGVAPLLAEPKDIESMKFDDKEKADVLLKQFSSVFTREPEGEIPIIKSRTETNISTMVITVEMVIKALRKININKSCGPDMLHPRLLSELADIISSPAATLYNATLKHGVLPQDWKKAFVTPIYKKGSRHLPENYRQ